MTVPSGNKLPALAALTMISLSISSYCLSSPTYEASLTYSQQYSDNIKQSNDNEIHSFITEITPAFAVKDKGAKSDYRLSYAYRTLYYTSDELDDRSEHNLSGSVNRFEFDRMLKLSATANISSQERRFSASRLGNGASGAERTETRSLTLSADLDTRKRLYYDFQADLGYGHREVEGDELQRDTYSGGARLRQGSAHTQGFWDFSTRFQEDSNDDRQENHNGLLGINVADNVGVFATAESETVTFTSGTTFETASVGAGARYSNAYSSLSVAYNEFVKGESGSFLSADLNWVPTERTSLNAGYTKRFFGDSYYADFRHRTRHITQTLSYSDTIDNFTDEVFTPSLSRLVCPVGAPDLTGCLPATAENIANNPTYIPLNAIVVFRTLEELQALRRGLSYTLSYQTAKSTISLNAAWNRNEVLEQSLLTTDQESNERILSLTWNWNVGAKTKVINALSWRKIYSTRTLSVDPVLGLDVSGLSEEPFRATDVGYNLTVQNKFSRYVSGSAGYSWSRRSAEESADEFIENRLFFTLIAQF